MIATIVAGSLSAFGLLACLFGLLRLNDYIIGEPRGWAWPLFGRRK